MSNNEIASMLIIALVVLLFILIVLIAVGFLLKIKSNNKNQNKVQGTSGVSGKTKVQESYNLQSVFKFMEFDKIEDNMIVQKGGKRYIMVVKFQGINYDLMSGMEKTSVEQGFIQYLNTLRFPVQIYIQTRTVDLTGSISNYKQKVKVIGDNLAQKEFEYNQKVRAGNYDKAMLDKEKFEIIKARNLYEYGIDIVGNTETMSLNKNILTKQYYIVLSYYPEEANDDTYAKNEIRNMAFSELYTRAQSTIASMSACEVQGKILDSIELADLLYTAYNRAEAEIYDLNKALNAGYDNMYVTAPDVLDKRIKELDKQMEIDAIAKANEAVYKVKVEQEKERQIREKEEKYKEIVTRLSATILEENENVLGKEVVDRAKKEISKESKKDKEEEINESKKNKKPGRPRKTA